MSTDVDSFLAHYGVKGMKWGVVKKREPGEKSNYRVNLEGHYISKGLSPADAAISAERRINVQKIIAAAGAVTVVAALGYTAGRHIGREFVDVKLKEGTPLQHVTSTADLKLKEMPFFTTYAKGDKKNIHALFPQVYQIDLAATKTITAPSNAKARKMLSEVLGQSKTMTSKEYARFNYRYFYDDSPESQKVVSDFFGKVKAAGYNSVLDPKPGGYAIAGAMRARLNKPLILLDGANSAIKLGEKAVDETLRKRTTTRLLFTGSASNLAKTFSPQGIALGAGLGTAAGVNQRMKVSAIDNYYKAHPTSTYTRSELAAMLVSNTNGYDVVVK